MAKRLPFDADGELGKDGSPELRVRVGEALRKTAPHTQKGPAWTEADTKASLARTEAANEGSMYSDTNWHDLYKETMVLLEAERAKVAQLGGELTQANERANNAISALATTDASAKASHELLVEAQRQLLIARKQGLEPDDWRRLWKIVSHVRSVVAIPASADGVVNYVRSLKEDLDAIAPAIKAAYIKVK